jgi:hypothetical protein
MVGAQHTVGGPASRCLASLHKLTQPLTVTTAASASAHIMCSVGFKKQEANQGAWLANKKLQLGLAVARSDLPQACIHLLAVASSTLAAVCPACIWMVMSVATPVGCAYRDNTRAVESNSTDNPITRLYDGAGSKPQIPIPIGGVTVTGL